MTKIGKPHVMKTYMIPAFKVEEAQAADMLAESLTVYTDKKVNGGSALTKEDNAWDIWADE